jgi:hypothetical protein
MTEEIPSPSETLLLRIYHARWAGKPSLRLKPLGLHWPTTLLLLVALISASSLSQTATVTVEAATVLHPINPLLYGINTARWDESLFPGATDQMLLTCDRDAIARIKASGITLLKYPGGNDADAYIWNSPDNNATEMNTDEYIALCREVHAEPFITVNFNATVDLAASWVRYCRDHGYGVRYWEVGDEQWGAWAKGHTTPEEYAKKYVSFVQAMRAADPSIKVATNVPLGDRTDGWTSRVLKAAADYIDMLTVTFYPQEWGKENDDTLLASTALYARQFTALRGETEKVLGTERARSLLYVNVGYNSVNHSPGPQTVHTVNALWVADLLGTMAEVGTDVACYWAIHNAYPPRGGDYGYLSSDGSNTPRPSYYVFPTFTRFFLGNALRCESQDASVAVHAARNGKSLCLVLINKDSSTERPVRIALRDFIPASTCRCWILDRNSNNREAASLPAGKTTQLMLRPYSMTTLLFISADSVEPPRNLALQAHASASSFSTIGPAFGPSSAIDGNNATRWESAAWTNSGGAEAQWLQLTWQQPQSCARAVIRWGEAAGISYRLVGSVDGKSWTVLYQTEAGKGGAEEISFSPRKISFLRLEGEHGSKGISAYAVRELEVYAR